MWDWLSGYNYDYALATIPIQILLFIFYVERRHLPTRQSRAFIAVMVVNFIMTAADVVSCEMNEVWQEYNILVMYGINLLYFLAFLLRGWFLFEYTAVEVYARQNLGRKLYRLTAVPILIMVALTLATPLTGWIFGFYDGIGYQNGILYRGIYYSTYFYIIASLAVVFLCRHEINFAGRMRLYLFNGILILGILMRGWFIDTLVTSYFSLLAILVIYLGTQNPGNFIEKRGRLFNAHAFSNAVREYVPERSFWVDAFVIMHYSEVRELYSGSRMDAALEDIGEWMRKTLDRQQIFYLRNGCYVLITFSQENRRGVMEKILERFQHPWRTGGDTELYLNIGTLSMPPEVRFASPYELSDALGTALNRIGASVQEQHITLDEDYVERIRHKVQVKRALEQAVEQDSVEIYLQPIVRADTYELVGAEALARIIDPEIGFLSPAEFIPLAEENGSISRLGLQVFRKGCAFMAEQKMLHWLNVNLSPIQCMDRTLAKTFIDIQKSFGLDASMVHLEITEESFVNPKMLQENIANMRAAKFQFVLDDYGSGYSNALLVKSIPFVNIKIDIGMVRAHFANPDQFLPNTIRTFRDMGFDVTAEGVETREMAEELCAMGATYLQGYYFSKPLPLKDFVSFVNKSVGRKDAEARGARP